MMMIRDFARYCNCSIYTLRYYDKVGLLKPEVVDSHSNYRYYTTKQIQEYKEIKLYQEIGLSIQEIISFKTLSKKEIIHRLLEQVKLLESKREATLQLIQLLERQEQK